MDIRELGSADDPDALLDLSVRAFGPVPAADRPRWHLSASSTIGARQYLGAFDGGRLLAAARYHDMIQWWHGQPVPMAPGAPTETNSFRVERFETDRCLLWESRTAPGRGG